VVEKNHRLHEINTEAEGKIMKLKNKKNENENKESCENLCNLVVRKRKMLKDERGQLSIDFLVGISLFILALLFMAHFIPGMFVPFQSETIDLNSVAYRTSVILVEDPGWWDNGTGYGEDWEKQNIEDVRRVGFAIDKEHPNMLKWSKIEGFKTCGANLTRKLGLYRNIGGNPIDYGYNITVVNSSENILAARGDAVPEYGDVSSMKRILWTRTRWDAVISNETLEGGKSSNKALFYINKTDIKEKGVLDDGIRMIVSGFNLAGHPMKDTYDSLKIANIVTLTGEGYHIKDAHGVVNDDGGYASLLNVTNVSYEHEDRISSPGWTINNGTDTLVIFLPYSLFYNESLNNGLIINGGKDMWIELNFGEGIEVDKADEFPPGIPLESLFDPYYESMELIIKVW